MNAKHEIFRGGGNSYEPPIIESVMIAGEAGFQASGGYDAEIDGMNEENGTWQNLKTFIR